MVTLFALTCCTKQFHANSSQHFKFICIIGTLIHFVNLKNKAENRMNKCISFNPLKNTLMQMGFLHFELITLSRTKGTFYLCNLALFSLLFKEQVFHFRTYSHGISYTFLGNIEQTKEPCTYIRLKANISNLN